MAGFFRQGAFFLQDTEHRCQFIFAAYVTGKGPPAVAEYHSYFSQHDPRIDIYFFHLCVEVFSGSVNAVFEVIFMQHQFWAGTVFGNNEHRQAFDTAAGFHQRHPNTAV